MTAPADGFFLRLPGFPTGRVARAVRVDVAENGPERFSQIISENPAAERLVFDRGVWNSQVTELAAIATTIAAPRTNIEPATGEIRYALRVIGDVPARGATGAAREMPPEATGRPVLGAPLLCLRLPGLAGIEGVDPAAEGITPEESLRRSWVLALYEQLALCGRRAELAPDTDRAGGAVPWAVVGGVVLVSVAISAIVYGVQRAEIARSEAVELEVLRNGARGMEERLRVYERTGTMPPVTQAENDAREVMQRRANAGLQRAGAALSDAIREAGNAAGKAAALVAIAVAGYFLVNSDK